jgi:N-acetylglutamate synthase-like GNAT family acetyltransferase
MSLKIRSLTKEDSQIFLSFSNENIGERYYTKEDFNKIVTLSTKDDVIYSWVLEDTSTGQLAGVRLTFPPDHWQYVETISLYKKAWQVPANRVAYFKSLFVGEKYQGQGWGPQLSHKSIQQLKTIGTEAIVTHSWKESPGNTSQKYLKKMGFTPVGEHPLFWSQIDYDCLVCKRPPCQCTAIEMILYL